VAGAAVAHPRLPPEIEPPPHVFNYARGARRKK